MSTYYVPRRLCLLWLGVAGKEWGRGLDEVMEIRGHGAVGRTWTFSCVKPGSPENLEEGGDIIRFAFHETFLRGNFFILLMEKLRRPAILVEVEAGLRC